ncbi:hypothetical protein LJB93_02165 [Desulfovibrio sp. OttesenSCG-928-F07]|nr:hypothetical protein [Desulfovibrio sp. OttesenSCG-928-F07]
MLAKEIEKRRIAQSNSKVAAERLKDLRVKHMRAVVQAVSEMQNAQPKSGAKASFTVQDNGETAVISFTPGTEQAINDANSDTNAALPDKTLYSEKITLEWNIKKFDIELFSGPAALQSVTGIYIIHMHDGTMLSEPDFTAYIQRISSLLADRLA